MDCVCQTQAGAMEQMIVEMEVMRIAVVRLESIQLCWQSYWCTICTSISGIYPMKITVTNSAITCLWYANMWNNRITDVQPMLLAHSFQIKLCYTYILCSKKEKLLE